MPEPAQVRQAVEHYLAAVAARDTDAIVSCFAADAVQRDPVTADPNIGHDAIRGFFEAAIGGSDSWKVSTGQVIACGDQAAVLFTLTIEAGGGAMEMDIIEILRIGPAGEILSLDAFWDAEQVRAI